MTEPPAAEPGSTAVPTCYRHPDRETYVRCNRCERPICPDCMTSAAVGFQCPECVREGTKSVRQARTIGGGLVSGGDGVVTRAILGLLVVVFVLQQATGGFNGRVTSDLDAYGIAIASGEWWRLLTSVILHLNVIHILLNGYALYLFGPPLERWLGRLRFVGLFVLAGFGGSVAEYVFAVPNAAGLGASGAIFGLFGAMIVMAHRLHYDLRSLLVLLAINLGFSYALPGIGWRAHLGGLAVGGVLGVVLAYAPRRFNLAAFVTAVVVLVAIGAGMTAVRTHDLRNDSRWGGFIQQYERSG